MLGLAGTYAGYILGFVLMVDYAGYGVLTVLCFWVFGKVKWGWPIQLAAMIWLNCFLIGGYCLTFFWHGQEIEVPVQSFAVFAMIPILLYNGKTGPGGRRFRHAVYIFYPAHMLILGLIAIGLVFL